MAILRHVFPACVGEFLHKTYAEASAGLIMQVREITVTFESKEA